MCEPLRRIQGSDTVERLSRLRGKEPKGCRERSCVRWCWNIYAPGISVVACGRSKPGGAKMWNRCGMIAADRRGRPRGSSWSTELVARNAFSVAQYLRGHIVAAGDDLDLASLALVIVDDL